VGVLRAARERGVGPGVDNALELSADLLPAFPERVLARAPEDAVGKLRRAETGEADEPCLLLGRRRTTFGLDCRCERIAAMFSRARSRQLFASPRSPSRWKFSPRTIAGFEAAAASGRAGAGVVDETA
jgi:hypothetical protein